jgi:hypothetical protein
MRLYQRTWKEPIEKMLGSIFEGRCCQNEMKLSNVNPFSLILRLPVLFEYSEVEKV